MTTEPTTATATLYVEVDGLPAPQGSKRAYVVGGRARLAESSSKVKPWRADVRTAAIAALEAADRTEHLPGPLRVIVTFVLPRPRYHFGTGANAHLLKPKAPHLVDKRPDLDKLLRSTLDGLGEAGVWHDDAQVAVVLATKRYARQRPGAQIVIDQLDPQQPEETNQ